MHTLLLVLVLTVWSFQSAAKNARSLEVKFHANGHLQSFQSDAIPFGYYFNRQAKHHVSIATLDWPPYIGQSLCDRGWVFQFGVATLLSRGYGVSISFFPWARAVKEVESGQMDILFPEYYIEPSAPSDVYKSQTRLDNLVLSRPFPGGEIAFMKRAGEAIQFDGNLASLVGETIGVVRGYQNTPEFDRMMDAGQFSIVHAVNDLQLTKLLFANRVNLIIGDPSVLNYTVKHSDLPQARRENILNQMQQVEPALEYKHLFFAVSKRRRHWQSLLENINAALVAFKQSGEMQRIISNKDNSCKTQVY